MVFFVLETDTQRVTDFWILIIRLHQEKIKIIYYKNRACIFNESVVFYMSCGMIALKREVAVEMTGFPWSECQVRKLATSHCTKLL